MEKTLQDVSSNAGVIVEIARKHGFHDVHYVEYSDPAYDATLMMTPPGSASVLDVAEVEMDLEEALGWRVMLITPAQFELSGAGETLVKLPGVA